MGEGVIMGAGDQQNDAGPLVDLGSVGFKLATAQTTAKGDTYQLKPELPQSSESGQLTPMTECLLVPAAKVKPVFS